MKQYNPITPDVGKEIVKLRGRGMTYEAIAKKYGVTQTAVCNYYLKHTKDYTKQNYRDAVKCSNSSVLGLAQQGLSIGEISLALGISIDECRRRYYAER